jgi:hypothetical protein
MTITTPQRCEICKKQFRPRQGAKFNIGYWIFICDHCLNELRYAEVEK